MNWKPVKDDNGRTCIPVRFECDERGDVESVRYRHRDSISIHEMTIGQWDALHARARFDEIDLEADAMLQRGAD